MADKVKFGIKNVHIFPITKLTSAPTYASVIDVPGAVSFSMSAQGDINKFYADNIVYYQSAANNGYEGDLTLAMIPEKVFEEIFRQTPDTNGVMTEDASKESRAFAMTFEEEGDVKGTKFVLYNCTATRPQISGQTKEEAVEVQTESITINAATVYFSGIGKNVVKSKTDDNTTDATYNAWFSAVYVPGTSSKAVAIDGPDSVVDGQTITLTATTTPAGGTVVWTSNDTDVATVDGGVVTGVDPGSCVIMAQLSTDASVYATKVVTVTAS